MRKLTILLSIVLLGTVFTLSSCLKKDFDAPPDVSTIDPNIPVNLTIAQLKAKMGNTVQRIDSDWTIYGIVNADDRSGNLYKQINIQDSTGGITLLIDANSLYTKYPIGRKVYVHLKGLYYGFYSKFPQLGYAPDYTGALNNIPGAAADKYIVRANYPNEVPTVKFTDLAALKTLNVGMIGRLVEIEGVEVAAADTMKTYSDSLTSSSITIEDCSGNKIVMRTSNFANFHSVQLPKGKGKIVALYTNFNTTPQLVIRDTNDLQFYGPRCGAITGSVLLNQNFEGLVKGTANITGWINFAEAGSKQYVVDSFGGTKFAKITAFGTSAATVKTWLVSPALALNTVTNPKLTFKTIDGYDNGATLKVYISTNYTGSSSPSAATWTQLNANISSGHSSGYAPTWTSSGSINLSSFNGTAYIAFVYEGADVSGAGDKTTTYEIDDVVVNGD